MSNVRVGSIEVEFPDKCRGRGDLQVCPEILKLIELGKSKESRFKERAERTAMALGEEACATCTGLQFGDTTSGMTWRRKCMLTGFTERRSG